MKEDGHFFLVVGGTSTNPIIHYEVLQQALAVGFKFQNEIVWVKNITIGDISYGHFKPINSDRFVNHTYEFIFHLTRQATPQSTDWRSVFRSQTHRM